jgi:predicted  nucleic acid-binding Zn-ribbon protein
VQLEKGNVVTDWHPHLDDGVDIAIANTTEQINNVNQTIKSWVTFYDSEFTKTDEAITAHARRITANENNLTEIRETTEAQFQVQADRINSIVSDVETLDNKVDNNYSEI